MEAMSQHDHSCDWEVRHQLKQVKAYQTLCLEISIVYSRPRLLHCVQTGTVVLVIFVKTA